MFNANNCWHFNIYEQEKTSCSAELSIKKSFIRNVQKCPQKLDSSRSTNLFLDSALLIWSVRSVWWNQERKIKDVDEKAKIHS